MQIIRILLLSLVIMANVEADISTEKMAAADPWYWAYINKIKLVAGQFDLNGHEYQVHWMQNRTRRKCSKKGTQGGWTDAMVLECTHGLIYGRYPQGVGYLFPTQNEVSDFSNSRFKSLIESNPSSIGKYVQSTDSVNLKKIGDGLLYLRGARLSQKIENLEKESGQLRFFSADKIVFDECDLMAEEAMAKARGRMGHSTIKEESYLSNPTIPGFGIDKMYQDSNQMVWLVKCDNCGHHTCLERDFPKTVRPLGFTREDGLTGIRVCMHCASEIFPRNGHWEATEKDPATDMEGYWWSQLQSIFVDPGEILRTFENPPEGNLGDVYRLMLGMAFIEAENKLTKQQVYSCCGQDLMKVSDKGPCAMGVDVGKKLHVIIGYPTSEKTRKVIYANRVDSFSDLHELGNRFNVDCAVVDYYPETRAVRALIDEEPYTVLGSDYLDRSTSAIIEVPNEGVLKVARTEICDTTHKVVADSMIEFPRRSTEMEKVAEEMSSIAKVIVTDEITGRRLGRYIKTAADHYRHSLNYFEIACRRVQPRKGEYIRGGRIPGAAGKKKLITI